MVSAETENEQDAALPGAAELDAIELEAMAVEGAAQASAQPEPQASNTAAELLGGLQMIRLMAHPLFADWPQFGEVWGDRTLQGIAESGGAIMDRHGWTVGEFMTQWGPYIGLIAAVGPAGLATYQHLQIRKAEEARRAKEAEREKP